MTASEASSISLPHWRGGARRIRYLYLAGDRSFQVTEGHSAEEHLIPLFLGADLFSGTDVRTENHPRYHAKFAKKGLAAKLVFSSDHRFNGLRVPCSSNSLWFYSIQGVFRVAFELYSKQEQLSVLESFQDLWKSRIKDNLLKMTYDLSVRLDSPQLQHALNVEMRESQDAQKTPKPSHHGPESAEEPLDDVPAEDHDYCSPNGAWTAGASMPQSPVRERLRRLDDKLSQIQSVGGQQQECLLALLRLAEVCAAGPWDEAAFTSVVSSMLQTHRPGSSPIYSSPLLQAVAGWLGRQFHAANSCISQQVEDFKVRHIERITDLPPAEELTAELFPEAMRALLTHWMGLTEEATPWKRHSEYPILLLILEFANHNLITGVAHVLYSSLICK
ncbi:uncharacterized protein LOC114800059 [Denticeps clupeoides]|uniref:uncharacterized protein LOC114800059 n=1 Tax=Denticeps clupeoides TaxID=299321 RepID=UPI0010A4136F|nr:uncharacterized protein LOC114800059 [Denticeps clupeoides]